MPPASRARGLAVPPELLAAAGGPAGAALSRDLLAWYDHHKRSLPWRAEGAAAPDPYRTWVSEIMLQQTRVDTVVPYFERFLGRFPTVQALAAAPLDEVLGLWSGLGYYSRARNLHAAARQVVALGAFPDTVAGLRTLPGVGPYVAGAVASMALGLDVPAVDGNVERVLSRLWAHAGGRRGVELLATAMLPAGRAGDFNQALMDLGSGTCTPRSPSCGACPLAGGCRALALDQVESFPPPKKRRPVPERQAVALVLSRRGRVLLARRPDEGLFGGLFELPGDFVGPDEDSAATVGRVGRERLGLELAVARHLGEVHHVLTHMRIRLAVLLVEPVGPLLAAEQAAPAPCLSWYVGSTWADPATPGDLGLSTLARKALALVAAPDQQLALL